MAVPRPEPEPSDGGWKPVDLGPILRGEVKQARPNRLMRADQATHLFYPHKVHWISGEPEGMKTWFALIPVADAIMNGETVGYWDFEGDAEDIVERLLLLGCTKEAISKHLDYMRPEMQPSPALLEQVLELCVQRHYSVAVLDGIQAAMGLEDLDSNKQKDFYKWWNRFGGRLKKLVDGPTIGIDHVIKDPGARNGNAAGTYQKQAMIDVHFSFEKIHDLAPGMTGKARIVLSKDKKGRLRRHQNNNRQKVIGILRMQSDSEEGPISFCIEPPDEGTPKAFRPTVLMQRVSEYLEKQDEPKAKTPIEENVPGKATAIRAAVDRLEEEGYVTKKKIARTMGYLSAKPYRKDEDPEDEDAQDRISEWPLRQAGEPKADSDPDWSVL